MFGAPSASASYDCAPASHACHVECDIFRLQMSSQEMGANKPNAQRAVRLGEAMPAAFDLIVARYVREGAITGTPTGFPSLDELTNGLQPGELILLASRPGIGKTAFVLEIASRTALAGGHVYVHATDLSPTEIAMRLIAMKARVGMDRLRSGQLEDEDWQNISLAIRALKNASIVIGGAPLAGLGGLRQQLQRVVHNYEPDLIVVDDLEGLVGPNLRGKTHRAKKLQTLRALKLLALQSRTPVLLSALLRKRGVHSDKRPTLMDVRSFEKIRPELDTVMFLHREDYFGSPPKDGLAEIIVPLQGNGNPSGVVLLDFDSNCLRFEDMAKVHSCLT